MGHYNSLNFATGARRVLIVLALLTTTFFPLWIPQLDHLQTSIKLLLGSHWNWVWPIVMGIGTWIGFESIGLDYRRISTARSSLFGLMALLAYLSLLTFRAVSIGIPLHLLLSPKVLNTLFFQLATSFAEEGFYRCFAFGALRDVEAGMYRSTTLRRVGPISLLGVSLFFGLIHGLNPVLAGTGSFEWLWFANTCFCAVLFNLAYVWTGSVWLPGLAHFFSNTIALFVLPVGQILPQLSTEGYVDFHKLLR